MIKFSGILLFVSYSLFAQPPKPEVAFINGDDYFYFIANSQVHQINSGRGQINDPDSLKDVVVMKIKLN